MVIRSASRVKAVGQCKAHCSGCHSVMPHHVVRRSRIARLARFSLLTMKTQHALLCARCHTQQLFTRPNQRALALLIPVVLLLASLA